MRTERKIVAGAGILVALILLFPFQVLWFRSNSDGHVMSEDRQGMRSIFSDGFHAVDYKRTGSAILAVVVVAGVLIHTRRPI